MNLLSKARIPAAGRRIGVPGTGSSVVNMMATGAMVMTMISASALAQTTTTYPDRTVRVIVGFPAGTAPDTLARLVGEQLRKGLGQPVIVENMAGAGGNIAASHVARAAPDGYTLLLAGNASMVVNQFLYEKLPYDPVRDLLPISQVATTPNILVVHPDVPATTAQELAAVARAEPDRLIYAHVGVGTSLHLAGEMFKSAAKITMRPVAHRGGNTIFPDLLAGRVNVCFCNAVTSLPLVQEGKLRALAVTSLKRWPSAPNLPTMDETGFPGFEATAWFGFVAPSGTPPEIIERLHRETVTALSDPATRQTLDKLGMSTIGNSPSEFAAAVRTEIPYWEKAIKTIGLKIP